MENENLIPKFTENFINDNWSNTDNHPHFILVTTRRNNERSIKLVGNKGDYVLPYYSSKKYLYPTRFKNKKSAESNLKRIQPYLKKGYKARIASIYSVLTLPILRKVYPKLLIKEMIRVEPISIKETYG